MNIIKNLSFCIIICVSIFVGGIMVQNSSLQTKEISANNLYDTKLNNIEDREVYIQEMDPILYYHLMYIRDGSYPDLQAEDYVKLRTTDFVGIENLDLSDIRLDNIRITSVDGLGLFDFSSLKILNLSNNNLTEINARTFNGMPQLETLNVEGNCLEILDISTLNSVKILKAKKNNLKEVDLSNLSANGEVDLSFNAIESMSSLHLKEDGQNAKVILYGNKITDFVAENYINYDLLVGFQIEYDLEKGYNEHTKIKIYNYNSQNYYLYCVNKATKEATIIRDEGTLIPATYEIYIREGETYLNFDAIVIKVYKLPPTYQVLDKDGNVLDISKTINSPVVIQFDSNDDNYIVEYKINGNTYIAQDSVELKKSGNYSITIRAVSDTGDISQETAFTVEIKINNGALWRMLAIIFSVFAILGILYVVIMAIKLKQDNGNKNNK